MIPWWVWWQLRWWASTVCSLTILLSLGMLSSNIHVSTRSTIDDVDIMEPNDVKMFVDGDYVYKWDPAVSNAYVLQVPPPIEIAPSTEEVKIQSQELFLYKKNKISKKYQRVTDRFHFVNASLNSPVEQTLHQTSMLMMKDDPTHHSMTHSLHSKSEYPYSGGYSPSKNIIFPFKSPRDISSLEVPSGDPERDESNRYKDVITKDSFHNKRPPPQVVSHVVNIPKSARGRSKGMGGSELLNPLIRPKQIFATEPAPQTAVVGSTAVLPCRVMGKVGHLQWTKDGFGMGTDRDLYGFSRYAMIGDDDEGDYSLRIQPVMLDDDAYFQCQVSAIDGIPGIRSRPVRLTVYVPPNPPIITPKVLETTAGMQSVLECESVGGRPTPEIQWVDDSHRESIQMGSVVTSNLMNDGKRSIVRSQLTFTPRRYHNNNTITCLTSNQALSAPLTSSVSLRVMFLPVVQLASDPKTLIEGDDVKFLCSAQANPSNVTYRWFVSDVLLENKIDRTLKLEKISRNLHRNRISCEVTNKVGISKKTGNIKVHYGPTFRTLPRDVMAEEGKDATLKCNVDANPSPSIVWLKKGSNKIIGSGASIVLRVNSSSAGVYQCIATVRGKDFEFPELVGHLTLLLKGPPQIVSDSEQLGRLGDTVSIVCSTVSVPSPIKVTWTYKGREIDLDDPRYEMMEDEGKERIRNILVIHDSDSSDFGAYNCSVVNEYGIARKLITLQKEKRIPILLVVGGAVAVIILAVVVASLVFCNKKHTVKERSQHYNGNFHEYFARTPNHYDYQDAPPQPEKDQPEADVEPQIKTKPSNNMYSLPPPVEDSSLCDEAVPLYHKSNESERIQMSRPTDRNLTYSPPDRRKMYHQNEVKFVDNLHHSLSGEIHRKAIKPYEQEVKSRYEDDYRYRSQSQHDIHYPMDELGRRSMTNTSLLPTHKYGSSTEPEYCTIRRGSTPYHHRNGNGQLMGGSSKTPLLSNGSLNYCSPKRSPYNSSSLGGSWTPHPPPYQRALPSLSNGRPVSRHPSNPPITTRPNENKVKFSSGSKIVTGATYI